RRRRRGRRASLALPDLAPRAPGPSLTDGIVAPMSISIVRADDHEVVRAGLRLLLQNEEGIHVIGEAGDVPGALHLVQTRPPDVLVLDLILSGYARSFDTATA